MSLFKSNKNKTSSAASTPAQTPRPSVDAQRPSQVKMTRDQALELALRNSMNQASRHLDRVQDFGKESVDPTTIASLDHVLRNI
ncbi:MAG: hypothetical protein JOS17DRAFT_792050 [Linnemannia elongata]|nr:MAG: hypothetical protein JOS17DRAFT_792050 [Linnemannia elongata]